MKKTLNIFSVVLVLVMLITVLPVSADVSENSPAKYVGGSLIEDVYTDKAMYNPQDEVLVTLLLENKTDRDIKDGEVVLRARHLNVECGATITEKFSICSDEKQEVTLEWLAPDKDFTGYLLEIDIYSQNGVLLDSSAVGVDVSSSWIKFPRYGYLWDYSLDADTAQKIEQMNRFHINAIEYYDWQYRHHESVPAESTKDNVGVWDDWSGRLIYGDTIKDYISEAKDKNMVNMAYNMIYAATDDFFVENPNANQWKIKHKNSGEEFKFDMGYSPSGNGHLYFMNPLNPQWQNHLFSEMNRAIDVMGFDGFHGDTVGDWGEMTDYYGGSLGVDENGNKIYSVIGTYTSFLNACKDNLPSDKFLSFNPVGAKGIENVNISNTDVLYTEFWPWDSNRYGSEYTTYRTLAKEVEDSMNDSKATSFDGKGKSLVVKAYINYTDKNEGYMNEPAVLLTDASVFAAGGSRLEIGNGAHMLHHEYYPNDNIPMNSHLSQKVQGMYDFSVAYENILRDGQYTTDNKVSLEDYLSSKDGKSNTVWTYTRADGNYELLHLINLLGSDNEWRDENRTKSKPQTVENVKVRYYNTSEVNAVYLASPDYNHGRSMALPFTKGNDGKDYVEFTVPSLEYWDMIYMTSDVEGNLSSENNNTEVLCSSFFMEGEEAKLVSNGGNPSVRRDVKASSGAYIHDIGLSQGRAEFTLPQNLAKGKYTLEFSYSSGTNGEVSIWINDREYTAKYKMTDKNWSFSSAVLTIPDVEISGGDVIKIRDNRSDCYIWIDYLVGNARVLDSSLLPPIENFYKMGDVDLDGKVNIMDATEIQRHLAQIITLEDDAITTADANGDGDVNILDATHIQRFLAQLIPSL